MITAPPNRQEWKLDRTPDGGVLKKVEGETVTPVAWIYFSDRHQCYYLLGRSREAKCDDLELALDILWSWRSGYHHPLCECDMCIRRKEREERMFTTILEDDNED
ncbi:MAG TPA: hypothetical protein PKA43_00270 [Candidatus Competibacter phosphatis]|nr:hypothetical protein [Candidatus Competibacter phosphatis]